MACQSASPTSRNPAYIGQKETAPPSLGSCGCRCHYEEVVQCGRMEAIHIPSVGGDRIKAYKKYGIGLGFAIRNKYLYLDQF